MPFPPTRPEVYYSPGYFVALTSITFSQKILREFYVKLQGKRSCEPNFLIQSILFLVCHSGGSVDTTYSIPVPTGDQANVV